MVLFRKGLSLGMIVLIAFLIFSGSSASSLSQTTSTDLTSFSLIKSWETEKVFLTPEAVLYDAVNEILYVANINGSPVDDDGNGFVSKLNLDGEIETLEWITGLSAPKGMATDGSTLYVADLDALVEIDIAQDQIVNRHRPEGAILLNDVVFGPDGELYITDTNAGKIFKFENNEMTTFAEGPVLNGANGITLHEDVLLTGSIRQGTLISVSLENAETTVLLTGFGAFDGIVPDGNENFWVSDFNSRIFITNLQERRMVLRVSPGDSADIEYIVDRKLLLVPTFRGNQVVAYEVQE